MAHSLHNMILESCCTNHSHLGNKDLILKVNVKDEQGVPFFFDEFPCYLQEYINSN